MRALSEADVAAAVYTSDVSAMELLLDRLLGERHSNLAELALRERSRLIIAYSLAASGMSRFSIKNGSSGFRFSASSFANAGTPIKTLQTVARHADPRLTLNTYGHVSLFDTGKAIGSLADPFATPQKPQRAAASGTDGRFAHRLTSGRGLAITDSPENPAVEDQPINEPLAHYLPTAVVANCQFVSQIGLHADCNSPPSTATESPGNAGSVRNPQENRESDKGWMTGFEPAIPRSTIWCLNR
jgi:hypothetical protein